MIETDGRPLFCCVRRPWLAAVLVCACFAESSDDPSSGATTEPSCAPGTASCVCNEGACDEGLECDALAQQCVPTGCTPGAIGCVCSDGQCFGGASCRAGLCTSDDPGTSGAMTSDASTSSTTTIASTGSSGAGESSSEAASTGDACMPGTCSSCAGCAECRECLAIEGCDEQTFDCYGDCAALVSCTWGCTAGDDACLQTCCCTYTTAWADYNALQACIDGACLGCGGARCDGNEC